MQDLIKTQGRKTNTQEYNQELQWQKVKSIASWDLFLNSKNYSIIIYSINNLFSKLKFYSIHLYLSTVSLLENQVSLAFAQTLKFWNAFLIKARVSRVLRSRGITHPSKVSQARVSSPKANIVTVFHQPLPRTLMIIFVWMQMRVEVGLRVVGSRRKKSNVK